MHEEVLIATYEPGIIKRWKTIKTVNDINGIWVFEGKGLLTRQIPVFGDRVN